MTKYRRLEGVPNSANSWRHPNEIILTAGVRDSVAIHDRQLRVKASDTETPYIHQQPHTHTDTHAYNTIRISLYTHTRRYTSETLCYLRFLQFSCCLRECANCGSY